MPDKIENVQQHEQQHQDGASKLSNLALDLMKGAALGGIGAHVAQKAAEGAIIGGAIGAVGGGALRAAEGAAIGGAVGAAAAAAAKGALDKGALEKAAVGGVVGGGAVIVGNELIKENQKEINKVGNAIQQEANRQLKEIKDTPKDVIDHIQKRPVTAAVETIILGPAATVLDAKLRKWFGN
jgi:hypothetical protein